MDTGADPNGTPHGSDSADIESESESESVHGMGVDTGTGPNSTDCADGEHVYGENCAALCESMDNQSDCEAVILPKPQTDEYWFFGHDCIWYDAVEARINDDGVCEFGEKRPICGYAGWGDINCGGATVWCDGDYLEDLYSAFYIENGSSFIIVHYCSPQQTGSIRLCRDNDGQVIEECECACQMLPDAGV